MINADVVERIRQRLRELGGAPTPKAEVSRLVIRSGDQLLFRAPLASDLSSEDRGELLQRFDPSSVDPDDGDEGEPGQATYQTGKRSLLGPIVVEFGYDIVDHDRFQRFLAFYEQALADSAPNGVRYRGTYVVNLSTEKSAGQYRTLWSFRSVNALNRIGAALKPGIGINQFGALMKRFRSLVDDRPGAGRSQQIYQPGWGTRRGF